MKYPDDYIDKVICGDCLEVMKDIPDGAVDLVLTDPPYPNYNTDHGKKWEYVDIQKIPFSTIRQFVFWSAVRDFPLSFTARHIWHKPNGQSNEHYEFIYERNGNKIYRVWRIPIINYQTLPEWTPHPTQKPLKLIKQILIYATNENAIILDPFLGSGTTAVACKRNVIEIDFITCFELFFYFSKQYTFARTRRACQVNNVTIFYIQADFVYRLVVS